MFSSPASNRASWVIAVIISLLLLLLVLVLGNDSATEAAPALLPQAQTTTIPLYLPSIWLHAGSQSRPDSAQTQWGLVFANSAEVRSGAARLQRAVGAGASFDRFPFYWPNIERSAGQFDWSSQDAAVAADESKGLQVLPILLSTPGQYYPASLAGKDQVHYAAAPPVGGSFLRNQGQAAGAAACSQPRPPPPRDLFATEIGPTRRAATISASTASPAW